MLATMSFLATALLGPATMTVVPQKSDPPPREHYHLTARELAELHALAEAQRRESPQSRADRCYAEEVHRAGGSPSDLDRQAIDLKCRRVGTALK